MTGDTRGTGSPTGGSGTADLRAVDSVRLSGITKVFGRHLRGTPALGPLDLSVPNGQFLAIVGPSGCGKSTLLRMIAGLTAPSTGDVLVNGQAVRAAQTDLGFVFQSPILVEWRSVLENVTIQALARSIPRREARAHAAELLKMVGIGEDFFHHRPSQLSGGMQQRVAVCRALLHRPQMLLMDEPFGALDALTRDQIAVDLQALWRDRRMTVVLVTHSIEEAVFLADRVVVMSPRPGRIQFDERIELARPRGPEVKDTAMFRDYAKAIRDVILDARTDGTSRPAHAS